MGKVYIVTPWYGLFAGGGERALRCVAETLKGAGEDVEVLCSKSESPYLDWGEHQNLADEDVVNGLPVHRFRVNTEDMSAYHRINVKMHQGEPLTEDDKDAFFNSGMSSDALVEYVMQLPEDATIICGTYYTAFGHQAVRAAKCRVILLPAFHDEAPFYFPQIGATIERADAIMFLSEEERDLVSSAYARKLWKKPAECFPVTGLPIAPAMLDTANADASNMPAAPYILYAGRIEEGKGVKQVLEWFASVRKQYRDLSLVMIGSGQDHLLAGQPVDYRGFVDEDEKLRLMQGAMALVHLSVNESFSYSMMEAWSCETPVIVSLHSLVTRGHVWRSGGGLVCETVNDFAKALQMLGDQETRDKMGRAGAEYVRRRYDEDAFLDRLVELVRVDAHV